MDGTTVYQGDAIAIIVSLLTLSVESSLVLPNRAFLYRCSPDLYFADSG